MSTKTPATSRFLNAFANLSLVDAPDSLNASSQRLPPPAVDTSTLQSVTPTIRASASVSTKQPFDAFLVMDVEGTCHEVSSYNYPNEIIEFPVYLLRWTDRNKGDQACHLEVVDTFRSFVKPTWRPTLSTFCTDLTGITQDQVDSAPTFPEVCASFARFLVKNGLIDEKTGARRLRFCWCCDGPYDIRDFVVKQCFLSKVPMPEWLQGSMLDVRKMVMFFLRSQHKQADVKFLPIPRQLSSLKLAPFEGRRHSGLDDTRNIARIVTEIARRGVRLLPNTPIHADRRWQWMGKPGEVLEEFV